MVRPKQCTAYNKKFVVVIYRCKVRKKEVLHCRISIIIKSTLIVVVDPSCFQPAKLFLRTSVSVSQSVLMSLIILFTELTIENSVRYKSLC